ncbi:hypothetical protein GF354_04690 [Candidatus Peregrinibacteria bacterium]|nr:hypothetical protein [Candidatus Peregrinibacteria bacterium]
MRLRMNEGGIEGESQRQLERDEFAGHVFDLMRGSDVVPFTEGIRDALPKTCLSINRAWADQFGLLWIDSELIERLRSQGFNYEDLGL